VLKHSPSHATFEPQMRRHLKTDHVLSRCRTEMRAALEQRSQHRDATFTWWTTRNTRYWRAAIFLGPANFTKIHLARITSSGNIGIWKYCRERRAQ
jgi:hypothetical protein